MYWKFKLPLIIVLLGVLVLLCLQAGKAFKQRTEKEKQLNAPKEETIASNPPAQPPSPDVQPASSDAPKALTQPKPFTVNEIPDSQEGKGTVPRDASCDKGHRFLPRVHFLCAFIPVQLPDR